MSRKCWTHLKTHNSLCSRKKQKNQTINGCLYQYSPALILSIAWVYSLQIGNGSFSMTCVDLNSIEQSVCCEPWFSREADFVKLWNNHVYEDQWMYPQQISLHFCAYLSLWYLLILTAIDLNLFKRRSASALTSDWLFLLKHYVFCPQRAKVMVYFGKSGAVWPIRPWYFVYECCISLYFQCIPSDPTVLRSQRLCFEKNKKGRERQRNAIWQTCIKMWHWFSNPIWLHHFILFYVHFHFWFSTMVTD